MGRIRVARLEVAAEFEGLREFFEDDNPGLLVDVVPVSGEATLRSRQGGMRVFWIVRGQGEVFLRRGYRTQEGDGLALPGEYLPEPMNPGFRARLAELREAMASFSDTASVAVRAILSRWRGDVHVGDYGGDLWRLDHVARPWSRDAGIDAILKSLFTLSREPGHSVKQVDSFEPVMQGDQLIVAADEALRVRGHFLCLAMENVARPRSHVSAVRRLRYLADTAGGCNPDFDPFRRLPLTWFYNYPGETGDGLNWVNSHVVNIPKETSPTHFHPPKGIGASGGIPQREMYVVLDPAAYRLNTWGRQPSLITFPELPDLSCCERTPLEPGMFVYIPPGTGHRGLDVFVNVLTIPGFKPHNEYYLDRDIFDRTRGAVPFNENLLGGKNYESLEDLLRP